MIDRLLSFIFRFDRRVNNEWRSSDDEHKTRSLSFVRPAETTKLVIDQRHCSSETNRCWNQLFLFHSFDRENKFIDQRWQSNASRKTNNAVRVTSSFNVIPRSNSQKIRFTELNHIHGNIEIQFRRIESRRVHQVSPMRRSSRVCSSFFQRVRVKISVCLVVSQLDKMKSDAMLPVLFCLSRLSVGWIHWNKELVTRLNPADKCLWKERSTFVLSKRGKSTPEIVFFSRCEGRIVSSSETTLVDVSSNVFFFYFHRWNRWIIVDDASKEAVLDDGNRWLWSLSPWARWRLSINATLRLGLNSA